MQRYLLVALGGAVGAMLRYGIGAAAAQRFGTRFPVGTLVINLTACFLIGFVLEVLQRHLGISAAWRYLIPIGFIGAFSTFSTFEYEVWADLSRGFYWLGILYVAVSLLGGLIAVAAGDATARAIS